MCFRRAFGFESLGHLNRANADLKRGLVLAKSLPLHKHISVALKRVHKKIMSKKETERRKYGGFLNRKWGPAVKKGFLDRKKEDLAKDREKEPIAMYPDKNMVGTKTCELCGKVMPCKQWARHMIKYHNPDSTGNYESSESEDYPDELVFPPLPDGTQVTY